MEEIPPKNILLKGLKTLSGLSPNLYSNQKTKAKENAELKFIGEKKMVEVQNQLYTFDSETYLKEKQKDNFEFLSLEDSKTYWLNFHGIHNVDIIKKAGQQIGLDKLTIRHILDTTQRPKMEEYDKYLFFSIKSINKLKNEELKIEQLSFVLGNNFVISFQEEKGDHFQGVRNRIKEGLGFVRKKKSDYLLAQLLDAILDNYFESLDAINHEITHIEKELFNNPGKSVLILLETHKRNAQRIKKALRPIKEALQNINNSRTLLIKNINYKYFKDLINSSSAAIEEADTILKTLEGLTNIYFASLSQKMNETMKVLTTVATIFIPLTFIAGIYGMNFDNMPELHYQYGYHTIWGVMIFIALGMFVLFRVKKWM